MSDDMRINVVATSTGFEELGSTSVTAVNALSSAGEKLIRQLERQAGVLAAGAQGWKLYQVAEQGAAESQVQRIIELQEFITKHKLLKEQIEETAKAQQRFNSAGVDMVRSGARPGGAGYSEYGGMFADSDAEAIARRERQRQAQLAFQYSRDNAGAGGAYVGPHQQMADAAAMQHAATQAEYDKMSANLGPTHAEMMRDVANRRRQDASSMLPILSDKDVEDDQRAAYRRKSEEMQQYLDEDEKNQERIRENNNRVAAARRKENEDERNAMNESRANSRQLAMDRRQCRQEAIDDANVQKQLEQQGVIKPRAGHENEKPRSHKAQWAAVEGFRAVEDFAAGSAYGGLRGGLLASSNNLSQMGTAFGAYGGMVGAAVSATVILGSTAYEAFRKSSEGARKSAEATENFTETLSKAVNQSRALLEIEQQRRRVSDMDLGGATSSAQSMQDQIERYDHDITFAEEQANKLKDRVGAGGISADELQQWKNEQAGRREDIGGRFDPLSGVSSPGRDASSWEKRMMNVRPEALTEAFIKTQRELEESRSREIAIRDKLQNTLQKENEANRQRLQRNEDAEAEAEMERGSERFRAHKRGGRGSLTDWEKIQDRRDRNNQQNADDKSKFESGQSWFQNRGEQLMLAGMKTDKERASYQAEKEHQESLRKSAEAEKLGIITPAERVKLHVDSADNRDRQMRQAKYGDMETDGRSGFGSADVKSVGGINSIMQAIRSSQQTDLKSALMKNGDIAQEQLTAQQQTLEFLKSAPSGVLVF